MSDNSAAKGAASLTAALLARKGNAAPSGFTPRPIKGGAMKASAAPPKHAFTGGGTHGGTLPHANVALQRADTTTPRGAGNGGTAPGDRVRVTLRLDENRHLRLKLAAAHMQHSLQEILTFALDRYLDEVAPEILREDCVCLAAAHADGHGGR